MKKLLAIPAAAAAAGMLASASAAEVNFGEYARDVASGGLVSGSFLTIDGVEMKLSAPNGGDPYLDGIFDSMLGGLGVCADYREGAPGNTDTGPSGKCSAGTTNDDSVDGRNGAEAIMIDFTQAGGFDVRSLEMRGTLHKLVDPNGQVLFNARFAAGDTLIERLGGDNLWTFAELYQLVADGELLGVTRLWWKYVDTEFYVTSISDVPIPGALPLLLSGIAGLGFASRRRNKAAN